MITKVKQGKEVGRLEERLNNIDDVIQETLLRAEKKLEPKHRGVFAEELKRYRKERLYWKNLLRAGN